MIWFGQTARWQRLARTTRDKLPKDHPLREYYAEPPIDTRTPVRSLQCVALDLETTGLDSQTNHIISVGCVTVVDLAIVLKSAWSALVSPPDAIPESSAIIHRITDDRAAQGMTAAQLMPELLSHLRGRVLIAHHAKVEVSFLNALTQRLYGFPILIPVIDTLQLARRQLGRSGAAIPEGALRLANVREAFHLPTYQAHDALTDALACAELLIVLLSHLYPRQSARLKDVQMT